MKSIISLVTVGIIGAGALALSGCDRDDRALAVDRDKGKTPGYDALRPDEPSA